MKVVDHFRFTKSYRLPFDPEIPWQVRDSLRVWPLQLCCRGLFPELLLVTGELRLVGTRYATIHIVLGMLW